MTPSAPSLALPLIAAKNAAGMVSARTLTGVISKLSSLPPDSNPPDCEERVVQLRALRVQLLFQYSGTAGEECGTRNQ